ncbi:hypothetical protein [Zavarzinella formosa]|uniref:hypothetical protein n=1 Tax=Zavarzinella formosa TaxID=360055 RepID=UPI0012FB2031|nr:hypothetical protein [Zavarzinella formosa]
MVYFLALLIFTALSAACWFVSVSLCQSTTGGPDPAVLSNRKATAVLAVGAVALTSFVPFPAGYVLNLLAWAAAAFAGLGLKTGRAAVLFGFLAAGSMVTRMVILGFMDLFGL